MRSEPGSGSEQATGSEQAIGSGAEALWAKVNELMQDGHRLRMELTSRGHELAQQCDTIDKLQTEVEAATLAAAMAATTTQQELQAAHAAALEPLPFCIEALEGQNSLAELRLRPQLSLQLPPQPQQPSTSATCTCSN